MEKVKTLGKVPYKQTNPWGCGYFTLAHLFLSKNYISEGLLSSAKNGMTNTDLNNVIDSHGFETLPLYHNSINQDILPEDVRDLKTSSTNEEIHILPLIFTCKTKLSNSLNHNVLGLLNHQGFVFIIDSLKKNILKVRFKDIHEVYPSLWSVYTLYHRNSNDGQYVFLQPEHFEGVIDIEELTKTEF